MPEAIQESAVPGTVVGAGVLISPSGDQGPVGQTGSTGATGPAGPPGAAGFVGSNSFSTLQAGFTVPAVGSTVQVTVVDASWVVVGQMVYVDQAGGGAGLAGALQVTAKSGNLLTLLNPTYPIGIPLADATQPGLLRILGNTQQAWLRDDGTWAIPGVFYGNDATNNNAYAFTAASDFSLVTGVMIRFWVTTTNTGSPTLNVSGTGAKNLCNRAGVQLSASELPVSTWLLAMYDGTRWNILSPLAKVSGAVLSGSVTLECAGYSSIAINSNSTAAFTLTLAHVPYGIPIGLKFYNATGSAFNYQVIITDPTGTSRTVYVVTAITNKQTGATTINTFNSAISFPGGGNIYMTGTLGTAGEAWFT
jgi:hypothetical protein